MSNLINKQETLDSREVAEMGQLAHSDLLKKLEGTDKIVGIIPTLAEGNFPLGGYFIKSTYRDKSGKENKCYLFTKKGCEFIANKFTGEKGILFTAKYVERFNEMEQALIPTGENLIALAVVEAQKMLEQKDREIEEMKPKALFADAVATSKSSILVGELAKLLKGNGYDTGQNRLFAQLRAEGFLIKRKGTDYNMPTQYSMELGLFEIKETTINHPDGHVSVNKTPKVTGKGQQYFINKYLKEEAI